MQLQCDNDGRAGYRLWGGIRQLRFFVIDDCLFCMARNWNQEAIKQFMPPHSWK